MTNQEEEGQGDGEEGDELGVGRGHAVTFAVGFWWVIDVSWTLLQRPDVNAGVCQGDLRCGLSSLISRLRAKFRHSHAI